MKILEAQQTLIDLWYATESRNLGEISRLSQDATGVANAIQLMLDNGLMFGMTFSTFFWELTDHFITLGVCKWPGKEGEGKTPDSVERKTRRKNRSPTAAASRPNFSLERQTSRRATNTSILPWYRDYFGASSSNG